MQNPRTNIADLPPGSLPEACSNAARLCVWCGVDDFRCVFNTRCINLAYAATRTKAGPRYVVVWFGMPYGVDPLLGRIVVYGILMGIERQQALEKLYGVNGVTPVQLNHLNDLVSVAERVSCRCSSTQR